MEIEEINFFLDFNLWTKVHYYAFKLRKSFPNLFFYYFSKEGIVSENFSEKEIKEYMRLMRIYKNQINGLWGVASLLFENKTGMVLYKMMNKTSFLNSNSSVGCIQNANIKIIEEFKVSLI